MGLRPVTLRALIAAHPDLFAAQTWYAAEPFMDDDCKVAVRLTPTDVLRTHQPEQYALPRAVYLAHCYVADPTAHVWTRYLWTQTTDREGQRVYLGVNNGKMEIHRHIHLTARFGVPQWPF